MNILSLGHGEKDVIQNKLEAFLMLTYKINERCVSNAFLFADRCDSKPDQGNGVTLKKDFLKGR